MSEKIRKTESPKEVKAERVKAKGGSGEIEKPPAADRPAPTELSKSEITMEVHHLPNLHHKEKPWKEYLLEYLMIFLAVMTGFFAESYREHISERSKEHEYAVNIEKDLVNDTLNLNIWLPSLYRRV